MFAVSELQRAARKIRPALGDGTSTLITAHVATGVVQLGRNLILSRLLAPEVYGAVGVITSILMVLTMISDLGFRSFVTRHATADDEFLQTVWSIRLVRALSLSALMFVAAEPLASLYASPQLAIGVKAAAGLFLVEGFSSMSLFSNERDRRIIRLSLYDFARVIILTVVSIIAAIYLRNYWAILIAMFAASLFQVYASYRLFPGPPMRIQFDRQTTIELLRFSAVVAPTSMISIILMQTDKFFLANFFPLAELGKFMLATAVAMAALRLIQAYVMRVSFPLIARVIREAPDQALKTFYGSRRRFTLVVAFSLGGVIGGGALAAQILFNDSYIGTGFYLSLVCLAPLATLSVSPAEQALVAKGFARAALFTNLMRLAWVAIAGPIAFYQFGPIAVVIVICVANYPALPLLWWCLNRYGLFSAREEFYIFAAGGAGAALGYAAQRTANWLVAAGYLPNF